MSDFAIKVENVSKWFKLPHEKQDSLKGALINFKKRGYETQEVLKDINFEVKKGEFFGIVGRNGSGKSTLLKLLAGIYTPNEGQVHIRGKLTPFIELGVGFNPELSGRENVYLNGALLGFSRKETEAMYHEIVAFAELERFMDQKLKNYSSGMQVRLAFSIAIRANSDVMIFDEVLAVGDAAFQQKCYDMFDNMRSEGRTVVLVTHDMSAVQRFCTRAILLNKGVIEYMGDPNDIADKYLEQNLNVSKTKHKKDTPDLQNDFEVTDFTFSKGKGYDVGETITSSFTIVNKSNARDLRVGYQIFSAEGVYCYGTNTKIAGIAAFSGSRTSITVRLENNLLPGTYYVTIAVMNENATKVLFYKPRLKAFNVKQSTLVQGVTNMDIDWQVQSV